MRTVVPARPGDERPRDGPDEHISLLSRGARRRKAAFWAAAAAAAPKVGRHVVVFIISALILLPLHIVVLVLLLNTINAFDFYTFDLILFYCVFWGTCSRQLLRSPKKSVTWSSSLSSLSSSSSSLKGVVFSSLLLTFMQHHSPFFSNWFYHLFFSHSI